MTTVADPDADFSREPARQSNVSMPPMRNGSPPARTWRRVTRTDRRKRSSDASNGSGRPN